MTSPISSRIHWVDYSKALLIFLVVLAHCPNVPTSLDAWITGFHMPAFFIISGYLHKQPQSIREGIKKNVKRLIVPSLLFSALCYVYWLIKFLYHEPFQAEKCIIKPLLGLWIYDPSVGTSICLIWFLVVLFLCLLLLDIVNKYKTGGVFAILSIIGALWVDYIDGWSYSGIFYLQRAMVSFPFVAFGFLMKKYGVSIAGEQYPVRKRCALGFMLLVLYSAIALNNGHVGIYSATFGDSMTLYYINSIIGSVAFFFFVKKSKPSFRWIQIISGGTIVILCLHSYIISILTHITVNPYIITGLIAVLSYPLILFFKKYLPLFVGR